LRVRSLALAVIPPGPPNKALRRSWERLRLLPGAPREIGSRKGNQSHVFNESSFTDWVPGQGSRDQEHPQQRALHGPFAGNQTELEGPRQRRMAVEDHLAPRHLLGRLVDYAGALTKGARVQIDGEITTRDYVAKSGERKTATEVRANQIAKIT